MDLGFWALAQEDPDHVAVVAPDGTEVTAARLLGRANQVVHALRALGLETGDVVATVVPNGVEMLELYVAALQAGWYLVPINHHLVAPEIAYILADAEASVLVGHERFAAACTEAAETAGVPSAGRLAVGDIAGFAPYAGLRDAQPTSLPEGRTIGDVMNYTSGTTGHPKGVHRKLSGLTPEEAALGLCGLLFLFSIMPRDDNVHLVGSPLYHTAVMRFAGGSLHLGHTLVVMDKWDPGEMLALIERHRVTTSHMVPTQFNRLLALPEEVRHRDDLSSLRHMIHAAAPCPIEVKRRMIDWWGPVIDEYYAASEGGGTLVNTADWLTHPGTVGRPWPISEIAIFDDEGRRLETPGEVGTVYMAMQTGSFEYHKDRAKTTANRIGDFFTVGDIGYLDDEGYLYLRDRKTDLIISGGANIYPAEVEAVLFEHPAVADVAVFGVPDEDWGEQVKAVVEPGDGFVPGPELSADIMAFCAGRLAGYKTPKTVDFVDEMPRDPNGKLYKRRLRDPFWEGRERVI